MVGSLDPSTNDPNSCTIILPSSNSNGIPFANFGILGVTYSFIGLNSSKASYVASLSVYSSMAYRPSCACVVITTNVVLNVINVVDL